MKKFLLMVPGIFFCASAFAQQNVSYLDCQSIVHLLVRCTANQPIYFASVAVQYSGDPCIEGQTWGYDQTSVWVNRGCRAQFRLENSPINGETETLTCTSFNNATQNCSVNGTIQHVDLIKEYSNGLCNFGHTWSWENNDVTVSDDCSAQFNVEYTPF